MLDNPNMIRLDRRSEIFFSAAVPYADMGRLTWDKDYWSGHLLENRRVRLAHGAKPCLLHFNGPIVKTMEGVVAALDKVFPWRDITDDCSR